MNFFQEKGSLVGKRGYAHTLSERYAAYSRFPLAYAVAAWTTDKSSL